MEDLTAPRVTRATAAVLRVLLQDPGAERYGREIAALAGLKAGTVQPILARWQAAGVLASKLEPARVAEAARRPRRRYYRFTARGAELARSLCDTNDR